MEQTGHKKLIFFIMLTLLSIAFMIFFNNVSTSVHLKELKILIQKNNADESNHNHINLIMNYKVNQKLYNREISQSETDLQEMRSNLLFLSELKAERVGMEKYQLASIPVLHMINGIRFFIGKGPIRDLADNKVGDYLSIAYYYERNRQYLRALNIYDQALKDSHNDRQDQSAIFLHQGYCHAMTGEIQKARNKYQAVIQINLKDDIMMTAMVLLKYLDGFEREINNIQENKTDQIEKSEKLYQLLAYSESLKILNEMEDQASPSLKSRIKYLRGRSQEELGQKEEALTSYQSIIQQDKNSPYARAANSRIFIAATREMGGEKIKELAMKNNETLKDEHFNKMAQEYQAFSQEAAEFESHLKENSQYSSIQNQLSENAKINEQVIKKTQQAVLFEDKKTAPVKLQTQSKPKRIQIRVTTLKGDIFTGEIAKETNHLLILKTLIGEVKIRKVEIKSRKNLN